MPVCAEPPRRQKRRNVWHAQPEEEPEKNYSDSYAVVVTYEMRGRPRHFVRLAMPDGSWEREWRYLNHVVATEEPGVYEKLDKMVDNGECTPMSKTEFGEWFRKNYKPSPPPEVR